jgi:hypothetical protein
MNAVGRRATPQPPMPAMAKASSTMRPLRFTMLPTSQP